MAKETGLAWTTFSVDDAGGSVCALVNDVTQLNFATPRAVLDDTGLDRSAIERLLGLADLTGQFTLWFNDDASKGFSVVKTISSTSVQRTMTNTVSGNTLAAEVWLTDQPWTRGQDGAFTAAIPFVLANGAVPTWA
jgi:hypothetical protein